MDFIGVPGRLNWRATRSAFLLLAVVAGLVLAPGVDLAAPDTERLANGDFEEGFRATPVGEVGDGWDWFHNGGAADYGFYRDTWAPVVYDGENSQLVEINTYGVGGQDADRYAGIYQTVAVEPGETYQLRVHGMLRALESDPDRVGYNYRVQYGIDYQGGTDWRLVDDWLEIPWDTVHPRLSPGPMESFSTPVAATSKRLTVFLRVWKKWGTAERELDVNLDSISLRGALPADANKTGDRYTVVRGDGDAYTVIENSDVSGALKLTVAVEVPQFPVVGNREVIRVHGLNDVGVTKLELYVDGVLVGRETYRVGRLSVSKEFHWVPTSPGNHLIRAVARDVVEARAYQDAKVRVGVNAQFIHNGGFEKGFTATPVGMVGQGWGWFHNGGRANFAFYDDTWTPVVHKGSHSQLISINTIGWGATDEDRYAGIHQSVRGLSVGADYTLTVSGMVRGFSGDPDRDWQSYRIEWGYAPGVDADWRSVDNWTRVPWDEVYPLLEPGEMGQYRVSFQAPSRRVTVFFRVWKLWATLDREVDVNIDAVSLIGYQ